MRRTFLIARQEFIKYVTRRGFFISILMFPLWIALIVMVPQWTGGVPQRTFTIIDRAGGYREAVLDALSREDSQRELIAMENYAATNADGEKLRRAAPRLVEILDSPENEDSLKAFRALGGWHAALKVVSPWLKPGAKFFQPPEPRFVYVPPPARLERAQNFEEAVRPFLDGGRFYAAILIPPEFGAGSQQTAQYFVRDQPDKDLRAFVADALSDALHRNVLRRLSPSPADSEALSASVDLESHASARRGAQSGRNEAFDSFVPIALALILFIVSVMNASVLLQGVVEEKSSRMIEVLLSCATPREITSGKLIGVIAVALVTIAIWTLVLFALMAMAEASTVSLVFGALRSLATIDTLPLLLLYFFCGLLIYGSIFLAIGSMANSLADAQALLGPAMLILMLPNVLISGIMRDPNGELASLISWVPFYTPFFMMLRIASHPPVLQLWGTTLLTIATTIFLIWWTGRIFANHVLTTERPPSLAALMQRGTRLLTRR
jgi:ABC-2 type transport system permease protein